MAMTSSRPYMVRALNEWIVDNDCTPHIVVNAMADDVLVPQQHVKDGQIILNISPSAVRDLDITNEHVSFNARFGGIPTDVYVPHYAILGIYARENGQGMVFEAEEPPEPPKPKGPAPVEPVSDKKPPTPPKKSDGKKPSLRVVK